MICKISFESRESRDIRIWSPLMGGKPKRDLAQFETKTKLTIAQCFSQNRRLQLKVHGANTLARCDVATKQQTNQTRNENCFVVIERETSFVSRPGCFLKQNTLDMSEWLFPIDSSCDTTPALIIRYNSYSLTRDRWRMFESLILFFRLPFHEIATNSFCLGFLKLFCLFNWVPGFLLMRQRPTERASKQSNRGSQPPLSSLRD